MFHPTLIKERGFRICGSFTGRPPKSGKFGVFEVFTVTAFKATQQMDLEFLCGAKITSNTVLVHNANNAPSTAPGGFCSIEKYPVPE